MSKEKVKHTPGPWEARFISKTRFYPSRYEINYGDDQECVAEYVHEKDDALLIAAAPDLKKALLPIKNEIINRHPYPDLLDENDFVNDICPMSDDYPLEITISVEEARAILRAIKKAEGEA
jgi:hypothetical protein